MCIAKVIILPLATLGSPGHGVHHNCSGDGVIPCSDELSSLPAVQIHHLNPGPERVSPVEIVANPIHC